MSTPSENDADEHTSLLSSTPAKIEKQTPLPRVQFGVLLFVMLSEPITSQLISPFINQLISELDITGGDETQVGYYSGLLVSLFFAVEALFTLQWSRLSDHIGRKPVILIGLFGLCISMIFFGLSRTFWKLVFSRCLAGMLNGNAGVMKSMVAEITDETNIAQAFALLPVVWSFGATVSPLIGGVLARPHDHFSAFHGAFWARYPYFLPCAVSAAFVTLTFLTALILLKESNPRRSTLKAPRQPISDSDINVESGDIIAPSPDTPIPFRELLTFPVVISIANYATLGFLEIALLALLPLFYSSPIEYGGLGFDPSTIGIILAIFGLTNGIFQVFFFAKIVKKWGAKRLFVAGMTSFSPIFLLFPVINALARQWGVTPIVWVAVALQLLIAIIMDMCYGCIFLFISSSAPNKRSLGAVNGLGQTIVSTFRAIGPATASSLFALSVKHNLLGGNTVYLILMILSGLSLLLAVRLPKAPWKRQ